MNLNDFLSYQNSCRTCLKSNCNEEPIFKEDICDKVQNLVSGEVHKGDGLPNFICHTCLNKLNNAIDFKNQVERINEALEQIVNNLKITRNNEQIKPTIPEIVTDNSRQSRQNGKEHVFNFKEIQNGNLNVNVSDSPVNDAITNEINENITELSSKDNGTSKTEKGKRKLAEKKLECDKCGKKYTNRYDLKVHLRKHSGVRPFSCKICKKTFADPRCFEKHRKIHSGEKFFKCELCEKCFTYSYTLKTHLRVHTGEKPFICAKCGHSFATTTQLKLHTRIHHTQERPYSCNLCSKIFASSSGLSNHKMTHTGERKFICSVCGKGSRTTSDLKCHLRTHTGEKPFKCRFPDCHKKYKTNSQLCTHMRSHMDN